MSEWYRKRLIRYAIGLVLGSLSFIGGYWISGSFWDAGILFMTISASIIAILHPVFKEFPLKHGGSDSDLESLVILIFCTFSINTLLHTLRFDLGHRISVLPVIVATFTFGMYVGARALDTQSSKASPPEDQPESSKASTAD